VAEPLQEAAEPIQVRHEEAPQDAAPESLPENGSPPAQEATEPTAPADEKGEPRKRSGGGRRHRARRGQDLTNVLRNIAPRV
jgi:hypothetical protein